MNEDCIDFSLFDVFIFNLNGVWLNWPIRFNTSVKMSFIWDVYIKEDIFVYIKM